MAPAAEAVSSASIMIVDESPGDRRGWYQREGRYQRAESPAQDPVGTGADGGANGYRGKEGDGRLDLRRGVDRFSRAGCKSATGARAAQPGARLGTLRLQESVPETGARGERRRHAGAGQLSGWTHVISGAGHRSRIGLRRGWTAGTAGAGAPALPQQPQLRGLRRLARLQAPGAQEMAAPRHQDR